jgi:hypothetical protein
VPPFRGGAQLRLPSRDHPRCVRWLVDTGASRSRRSRSSTTEPVVPITSARPPRPTLPLEPNSAAHSRASIPHRAEDAMGHGTNRDDGNRDRSS